jgi:hypothetical protein
VILRLKSKKIIEITLYQKKETYIFVASREISTKSYKRTWQAPPVSTSDMVKELGIHRRPVDF